MFDFQKKKKMGSYYGFIEWQENMQDRAKCNWLAYLHARDSSVHDLNVRLERIYSRQDAPKRVSGTTRVTFEGVFFFLLIKEVCIRRDKRIEIACIR